MLTTETSTLLATIGIPTTGGLPINVNVRTGGVVFLVGANGTGKSALIHHLKQPFGERAVYMPGSRPSYFDADSLSMTLAARKQLTQNLFGWDSSPDTRWRVTSGTSRNEKAVHDLQHAELAYDVGITRDIKAQGSDSPAIKRLLSNSSPLDKVNLLLEQANLPVRLLMDGAELKTIRGRAVYSFAKMSDGERTALLFAAEVVSAASASVFVVDEPELHLHRSIIVPLLKALMDARKDCAFIISTHELALPGEVPGACALLVRNCEWVGDAVASWSLDVIADLGLLPEDLRTDILGSRKKILFIEGMGLDRSLDYPLYSLLFPHVSVMAKESCKDVYRCVSGIRAVESEHHAAAFGLVDADGMEASRAADLKIQSVFALPMFAVESLYYCGDVLSAVAQQQASTFGCSPVALLEHAKQQAIQSISDRQLSYLASRLAERQLRDRLQFEMPTRERIVTASRVEISIDSPYPAELAKIKGFITSCDLDSIVRRYPVRESGVLSALAKGLCFQDRNDYERAALARIAGSEQLRQKVRETFGELSSLLV